MDDDFATVMFLLPCKIMVVLDVEKDFGAQILRDVFVDQGMIGGGVAPHQFHGGPVFLTLIGIERQPGQTFQFGGKVRMQCDGSFAVAVADSGACSAASTVTKKSNIFAGSEPE